jgi:hypothetical protein
LSHELGREPTKEEMKQKVEDNLARSIDIGYELARGLNKMLGITYKRGI